MDSASTRSYFSERNGVSFPERYSKSEKGRGCSNMKYLLTADQSSRVGGMRVVGIDRRLYIKVCCVACCLAAFPDSTGVLISCA